MPNHDSILPARSTTTRSRARFLRAAVLAGLLLASRSVAAGPTFVVNSPADVPAGPNTTDGVCETATGNGVCTLRAAIMEANGSQDAIVRIPAGVYGLTRIPSPGDHPENGDLDVLARMRIEGDGPSATVVDGSGLMRVFRVALPQTTDLVEFRGLTIRNGNAASTGDYGGGINIASRALLENVHLEGNRGNFGGAIGTTQTLGSSVTLRHCVVSANTSANGAGGILIDRTWSAVVEDSLITGNRAASVGGGILVAELASLRVERTILQGNFADDPAFFIGAGGGIFNAGNLVLVNSLLVGNVTDDGGAGLYVVSPGSAQLIHSTVSQNIGWKDPLTLPANEVGAGIYRVAPASLTLDGTIVTSNFDVDGPVGSQTFTPSDCSSGIVSGDYNLVASPTSCPLVGQLAHVVYASGFGTLAFNGGFARDVSSSSTAALGAVPASQCLDDLGAALTIDIRGHRRKPLACDIGAHDAGGIFRPALLLGINLLRNGGATADELGLASTVADPAGVELYQPPYWIGAGGRVVQILYGAPDGYPTRNDAPPNSGQKFFAGGVQALSGVEQALDVSAFSALIDAGTLPYEVAGSFGGYLTDNDRATLFVTFSSDVAVLDSFSLGGFSAADRGNQTKLMRAVRTGTMPIGTRVITLDLLFERTNGNANDGYADGISVTLPEPGLGAGLGAACLSLAGLARVAPLARLARRRPRIPTASSRTP